MISFPAAASNLGMNRNESKNAIFWANTFFFVILRIFVGATGMVLS